MCRPDVEHSIAARAPLGTAGLFVHTDRVHRREGFMLLRSALLVAIVAYPLTAGAAQRTFVSTAGLDAHTAQNCSLAFPCRAFNAALSVTDANGEIVVLDSGGYGAATITQGVSIQAPAGVYAGLTIFGGDGITVNAPGATVVLRGLAINGLGGVNGIQVNAVGTLHAERCAITNMSGVGIASTAAGAQFELSDVLVHKSGGNGIDVANAARFAANRLRIAQSGVWGLTLIDVADTVVTESEVGKSAQIGVAWQMTAATTSKANASFDRLVSSDNGYAGLFVSSSAGTGGSGTVSITRATFARNSYAGLSDGIRIVGTSPVSITVADTVVQAGNYHGIGMIAGAGVVTVSNSSVVDNLNAGFRQVTGTFYTRGNNTVRGNAGADITGQTTGTITLLGAL